MIEPEQKAKIDQEQCRLCMSKPGHVTMVPLSHSTQLPNGAFITIQSLICDCLSLKVAVNDELPDKICHHCLKSLQDWSVFKDKAYQVDSTFKRLQNGSNAELEQDIKLCPLDSGEDIKNETDSDTSDNIPLSEIIEQRRQKKSKDNSKRGRLPKTKPYCSICDFKFTNGSELQSHLETAHSEVPFKEVGAEPEAFSVYKCHICKEEFRDRRSLRLHCRKIHGLKVICPYQCSHCDRQFPSWGLLVIHERKHTGEKPYSCDICGKDKFISLTSVRRHKLLHLKVFSCKECGRDFNCDSALKAHIRCKHTNEKPFLCNICGRSFSLGTILTAHMTSHSQERKFTCDICGFASKTSGNHHRHRMRHLVTGEKLFHCEMCGKKFETKLKLSSHMIIHRPNRPHVCNVCGKGFLYNNKLERHIMLVHARQRPFTCEICGRKLASKFGLGIHLKTHLKPGNTRKIKKQIEEKPREEIKVELGGYEVQPEQGVAPAGMVLSQEIVQPIHFEIHQIQPVTIHHVQLRIVP